MSGYVYLIGPRDWRYGVVKIGTTRSRPQSRLSALQTGSHLDLQLFAYFGGGAELERVLHKTFAPLHVRGEWFRLDHKLLDLVSNLYPETFGESEIGEGYLWATLQSVVLTDEPGVHVDDEEAWLESTDCGALSTWMCGKAWAEHCQGEA